MSNLFRVTNVVDGDTFDVSPLWSWSGMTGTRVRPTGYDAPELHATGGLAAKQWLTRLLSGQQIEIRAAYRVDRGRLVGDVYVNGIDLATYYKHAVGA